MVEEISGNPTFKLETNTKFSFCLDAVALLISEEDSTIYITTDNDFVNIIIEEGI